MVLLYPKSFVELRPIRHYANRRVPALLLERMMDLPLIKANLTYQEAGGNSSGIMLWGMGAHYLKRTPSQMDVSLTITRDYEKKLNKTFGENKPN